jgi:hypothetical protein
MIKTLLCCSKNTKLIVAKSIPPGRPKVYKSGSKSVTNDPARMGVLGFGPDVLLDDIRLGGRKRASIIVFQTILFKAVRRMFKAKKKPG